MTEVLFTTYYAITLPDGASANQVSSTAIQTADESAGIFRSIRPAFQQGWLTKDSNFTVSFQTSEFKTATSTKFDEDLILIDNKNDQTHFFRAFYGTVASGQGVSSDGLQRYELIGSPVDSVSHVTILFQTQASGRKVRTVSVYGKKKEAEPAPEPATSNNTSANLLRALVGN